MPRILPLYCRPLKTPVELEKPSVCDPGCTRCVLNRAQKLNHPCVAPEQWNGHTGGLLVVLSYISEDDDIVGRPAMGRSGKYLRQLLSKLWKGSIVIDSSIKCWPRACNNITEEAVCSCRGYLASTIRTVKPIKVLALGQYAMMSLLGRKPQPMSVLKGYSWISVYGQSVPVYLLPQVDQVVQNRFLRRWFKATLQWALTTEPPFAPAWAGEARVVESMADAEMAAADLRAAGWFAYDVETAGYMWRAHQIICASLCPSGRDYAWVWADKALGYASMRQVLIELLRDNSIEVVGSNVKYDELATILDLGARVRGVRGDTRLLRRLLDADADADLETMSELVGMGGHKEEAKKALVDAARVVSQIAKDNTSGQLELIPTTNRGLRQDVITSIKPGESTKTYAYAFIPRDLCIRYNALDAVSTGRLELLLNAWLEQDDPVLAHTYHHTVLPAAQAVRQVEEWGVLVDHESIQAFQLYLQGEKREVLAQLERYAGKGFNPDSNDDIRKLLFKTLGLDSTTSTVTGLESTANDVLELMRHKHPVVGLVCEWRKVSKLDGTYATGMRRHVRNDGRIHPSFLLDGTRSGRASCRDPNLQTIPRDSDSEMGKMARDLFIVPRGYVMASIDYSQIELRVAAMLSSDPVMRQLFCSGEDFHWATAKSISKSTWGLELDSNNKDHKKYRTQAKSVNFGLLYGQGDGALASILGCSKRDATKVREGVLGRFNVLDKWIKSQLISAQRTGYCWTYWAGERARRRSLWKVAEPNGYESSKAARSSWNTPIQGTAAEYLTRSMTAIVNWILDEGIPAKVVLPVHDSILLEIQEQYVDEVLDEVCSIMTGWDSQDVPLVVDVEIGPAWGSLEKYIQAL